MTIFVDWDIKPKKKHLEKNTQNENCVNYCRFIWKNLATSTTGKKGHNTVKTQENKLSGIAAVRFIP